MPHPDAAWLCHSYRGPRYACQLFVSLTNTDAATTSCPPRCASSPPVVLQGIAPYNPEALGFSDRLPPLPPPPQQQWEGGGGEEGGRMGPRRRRMLQELEQQRAHEAAQAAWQPWSSTAVYSVADVAPLRWLQHVMAGAPPPAPSPRREAAAGEGQQQQEDAGASEAAAGGEPAAALQEEGGGAAAAGEQPANQQQQQQQPDPPGQQQPDQPAGAGAPGAAEQEGEGDELSSDNDMQDRPSKCAAAAAGALLSPALDAAAGRCLQCRASACSASLLAVPCLGQRLCVDACWTSFEMLLRIVAMPLLLRCRRRKRRQRQPLQHALWAALPPRAAAVVADVQPLLEPALLPKVRP